MHDSTLHPTKGEQEGRFWASGVPPARERAAGAARFRVRCRRDVGVLVPSPFTDRAASPASRFHRRPEHGVTNGARQTLSLSLSLSLTLSLSTLSLSVISRHQDFRFVRVVLVHSSIHTNPQLGPHNSASWGRALDA